MIHGVFMNLKFNYFYINVGATGLFSAFFGRAIGPVHISNLNCGGNESQLLDCQYIENPLCSHYQDAGVICLGKKLICNFTQFIFENHKVILDNA